MPVNLDKPHLWKADVARSVDMYNDWFMNFAPDAFRQTRVRVRCQNRSVLTPHGMSEIGWFRDCRLLGRDGWKAGHTLRDPLSQKGW